MIGPIPYTIAVLCYLFDADQRLLMLHRRRPPNADLYSPIGGKLDQESGESPGACAAREIREEANIDVSLHDLRLAGIVSETAYQGTHWLMFLYEVTRPVQVDPTTFCEGRLEWHRRDEIAQLPIPETDRQIIWPLFWKYRHGFFAAHINCIGDDLVWELLQPTPHDEPNTSQDLCG